MSLHSALYPSPVADLCAGEKGVVPQGHEGAGTNYHFKVRLLRMGGVPAGLSFSAICCRRLRNIALLKLDHGTISVWEDVNNTNMAPFSARFLLPRGCHSVTGCLPGHARLSAGGSSIDQITH